MIASFSRFFAAAFAAVLVVSTAAAAEPAIIAKARAYVGPEAALDGLTAVHYFGSIVISNSAEPAKETHAKLEVVFQKPSRQRIWMTTDKTIETTALDDYEGWTRIQDAKNPALGREQLLSPLQVKSLRAQTWQNLWFFRGLERAGGRVEDQGTATIDGIAARKVAFLHDDTIGFIKFFDAATGRLFYTETDGGNTTIREQGELLAGGLRFPQTMVQKSKNAEGQVQTMAITFEKVVLNETFAPDVFATPMMPPK